MTHRCGSTSHSVAAAVTQAQCCLDDASGAGDVFYTFCNGLINHTPHPLHDMPGCMPGCIRQALQAPAALPYEAASTVTAAVRQWHAAVALWCATLRESQAGSSLTWQQHIHMPACCTCMPAPDPQAGSSLATRTWPTGPWLARPAC